MAKEKTIPEKSLWIQFASLAEAIARHFPNQSDFTDKEIEELTNLIKTNEKLSEKEFKEHPLIIKAVEFTIHHKNLLINTVDKEEKVEEMTDLVKRTQANFENYRKQVEKRVEEIQDLAAKDLILQLLPVLDNLELALKSADKNLVEFRKGIELIYSQLFSILEAQGVKVIEAKKFDPYFHEPLLKVESEAPENSILEEFQKGFMLNNRVIRHAKVKLSAGKKKENNSDKNKELKIINPEIKNNENQTTQTNQTKEIKTN